MESHSSFHGITYINSGQVNWVHFKTNQLCKTRKTIQTCPILSDLSFFQKVIFHIEKRLLYQFRLCGWDHCSSSHIYDFLPSILHLTRYLVGYSAPKDWQSCLEIESSIPQNFGKCQFPGVEVPIDWFFWGDPKKIAGIHRLWRAGFFKCYLGDVEVVLLSCFCCCCCLCFNVRYPLAF